MRKIVDGFLDCFTEVVSHPWFFFLGVIGCVLWMVLESITPKPFDPPTGFFPCLVLALTIMGYWIESLMKVQQKRQSEESQAQMDWLVKAVDRIEDLAEDLKRNSELTERMVTSLDTAVDTMIEHYNTENEQRGQANLRPTHSDDSIDRVETG